MASRGRKQEHHDDCSQSSELRESRPKKSTGSFTIMFIFSLVAVALVTLLSTKNIASDSIGAEPSDLHPVSRIFGNPDDRVQPMSSTEKVAFEPMHRPNSDAKVSPPKTMAKPSASNLEPKRQTPVFDAKVVVASSLRSSGHSSSPVPFGAMPPFKTVTINRTVCPKETVLDGACVHANNKLKCAPLRKGADVCRRPCGAFALKLRGAGGVSVP